jgi:uncharacterized protein
MTLQVPYVGYLSLGDDPHLVANECGTCGALFFDRRNACASCGGQDFATRRLANDGADCGYRAVDASQVHWRPPLRPGCPTG